MRKKLNARAIETLPIPADKRIDYWDEILTGFGIRISPSGRKTWFAMGRVEGKLRRHTIGTFPALSLAEAREEGRKILGDMQLGTYDAVALEPVKTLTFGEVIPDFIEKHAKPNTRSWRDTERALQKFSTLNAKTLQDVKRQDVAHVLDAIMAKGTQVAANRALAAIKKMFSWALDRGLVDRHPVAGFKPPAKETSRDRFLSDDEVVAFWRACDELHPIFAGYFRVLLLTAQRREETANMRWSALDFKRKIWTIPASTAKNGVAHDVPLSDVVVDILTTLPRFLGSDLVFTTTGTTPISGFSKAQDQLEAVMGCDPWRIHDLRRTCASGLARQGVAPHIIEKLLNHVSGQISGVAAVYNRHGYDSEKRDALSRWAKEVLKLAAERRAPIERSLDLTLSGVTCERSPRHMM